MSIAVLNQVYDEARRLAVAGSVVAQGDFRLKKLLPPLEQAGAKAPVFAKVAEAARAVVEGSEQSSAENLLELTSLVTAVLYTQGETGAAGKLEPIESVDLGGQASQTSARVLKPLLEALSSTGSGRLELVKDAQERGLFRDLRLIKPALDGLDDPYPEIADLLAEKVLPLYGQAIIPELRAKYDPKGTKGHPRRLTLMHTIDPAGTRDLVKQALEDGSKEVKVAAIACLGAAKEDLPYLVEQAAAKAQDVRRAAYHALAKLSDPAAIAVLEKAITGKDLELATEAIVDSKSARLTDVLVAEIKKECDALVAAKKKEQVNEKAVRLVRLIRSLPDQEHKTANALVLELFGRRAELAKAKGINFSGSDVTDAVIAHMAHGPKSLQKVLAKAHAELEPEDLGSAFHAAQQSLPAAEVYDQFSQYLTAAGADGKKKKDPAAERREAIIEGLDGEYIHWYRYHNDGQPPPDPRWFDLAVKIKHLGLIHSLGRPGNKAAEAFLQAEYDAAVARKGKDKNQETELVAVMVRLEHPKATDALIASYEKTVGKANYYTYWYHHLIPMLPKSAIPRLEAMVPKLKDREADHWLAAIEELRNKK